MDDNKFQEMANRIFNTPVEVLVEDLPPMVVALGRYVDAHAKSGGIDLFERATLTKSRILSVLTEALPVNEQDRVILLKGDVAIASVALRDLVDELLADGMSYGKELEPVLARVEKAYADER